MSNRIGTTVMNSFSSSLEERDRLEELAKRYDLPKSRVVTLLINQDFERMQKDINGFVQTKIHIRTIEKRMRFSQYVNENALRFNIPKISHVDLENEEDLLCSDASKCSACIKRYIWREETNRLGQSIRIVVGVKM